MATPLRILYVEDVDDDATLVAAHLRRAGYAPTIERVETAADMSAALARGQWDLVLSDFSLPRFSAPDALNVLHASGHDLPFIIVSGTILEDEAVAALRAGAHDFVVKGRLVRLVPAITRELREAESRAARRREQAVRQELEAGFQLLFANSPLPMWMFDPRTLQFVEVNEAAVATYGYSRDEFLRMHISNIRPAEDVLPLMEKLAEQSSSFRPPELWRHRWKDGSLRDVEIAAHSLEIGGRALTLVVVHDVTERKRAEEGLRTSESRYRRIFETAGVSIWEEDFSRLKAALDGLLAQGVTDIHAYLQAHPEFVPQAAQLVRVLDVNDATLRMLQANNKAELLGGLGRVLSAENLRILQAEIEAIAEGKTYFEAESVSRTLQNERRDVLMTMTIPVERDQFGSVLVSLTDITKRKQVEVELAQERNLLRTLIDNVPDLIYAKDTTSRFTLANRASASSLGHTPEEVVGKTDSDLHPPELAAQFFADEQAVMQSGQPLVDREEKVFIDGQERWLLTTTVPLRDGSGRVTGLVGVSRDITQRRQHERELEAVATISAALRAAQTLDEMLSVWLDVTLSVMQATVGSVWLYDSSKDELRPAVIRGWNEPAGAGPVRPQKPSVGVDGYVFRTRQPYVSSNFQVDPLLAEGTRERIPAGGGVGIPIRVENQVIGTFIVNVPLGRKITPDDVHLLTTLAEIAGSAIHRMQLHEQTERRLSQLSALRAIDQAITASLDLHPTLAVFLDQVVAQLGVDAADVLLLDPQDQTLTYAAGRGFRTRDFQQARTRVGEGRAGRAVLERQIVVSDLQDDSAASKRTRSLSQDKFVSYFGVPLIAKGQVLGVLEIFHRSPLQPDPEWLEFLEALAGQAAIALDNAALFNNLQHSNTDLQLAYDATIEGWSRALDLRDKETEGHSQRVMEWTEQLAAEMGVSEKELVQIRRGALLHDIGKMGVPDHILLKPGPLSDDEWAKMRQHPTLAYEMLAPIQYLRQALEIPYCHHEKWDGTGYPRGLKGEKIPLPARIFAVVDVWDALCSDRPYRLGWPEEKVRQHIRDQAGKHFDPAVVGAFLEMDLRDLK